MPGLWGESRPAGSKARQLETVFGRVALPRQRRCCAGCGTALAPAIPNYAERRATGERIGSGGIDKGVDVVVNRRLEGKRGMPWWRARIEGIVALRVALLNDAWDRFVPPAFSPQ